MGRLSVMMFSLAVLLLAANSLPPVNKALLEDLVPQILNRCLGQWNGPMYSLAVSIPFNSETKVYDISQVTDEANIIKKTIIGCDLYAGTKVVAATVLRWPNVVDQCPNGRVQWRMPRGSHANTWAEAYNLNPWPFHEGRADHAEYRTLQNLEAMLKNHKKKRDLLLIYVYASPCAKKCANSESEGSILGLLKGYKYYKVAFVFSKVFQPRDTQSESAEDLQVALRNLGGAIGLHHIFRCDKVSGKMTCVNCKKKKHVTGWCYDDNQPPV